MEGKGVGVFACKSSEAKFNKAGSSFVCNDLLPPFPLKCMRVKNLVSKVLTSSSVVYNCFSASIRSQKDSTGFNRTHQDLFKLFSQL